MSDKDESTHEKSEEEVEELNDEEKKKMDKQEIDEISKDAEKNFASTEFKDKVIKYVKVDDMIRKKMEEIKELKTQKKPCEDYIIRYLEKQDAGFVTVAGGKLIKNESEAKAPLKTDIIKEAIKEGIKTKKLVDSNDLAKCDKITEEILELMEKKRPMQKRVNLKRTFAGEAKKKAPKKAPKKSAVKKDTADK